MTVDFRVERHLVHMGEAGNRFIEELTLL